MIRHHNGDRDIRASERAIKDDPDDFYARVKLLRQKLMAGLLSHDRLVMAARLGHDAAREAAPEWSALGEINWGDNSYHALAVIRSLGNQCEMVSFACDCVEASLPILKEEGHPAYDASRLTVAAVRSWIADPSKINSRNAIRIAPISDQDEYEPPHEIVVAVQSIAYATNSNDSYTEYAFTASDYAVGTDNDWQVDRLSEYLLGEVTLPTAKTRNDQRRNAIRNSDADIKALERAVREDSSDLDAYVKLLRKKLRAGLLSQDRLVMAARLGHEAARLAAPEWEALGEIAFISYHDRPGAIGVLSSRREVVSFACDCAERVLSVFEQAMPGDTRSRLSIEAARSWVIAPSERVIDGARVASRRADTAAAELYDIVVGEVFPVAGHAAVAAAMAAEAVFTGHMGVSDAVIVCESSLNAIVHDSDWLVEYTWQRARLAQYLLGEVTLPPINTAV